MRAEEGDVFILLKVELSDIPFLRNISLPNQDIQCYIGGTNVTDICSVGCGIERCAVVTVEET